MREQPKDPIFEPPDTSFRQNLRDLPKAVTGPAISYAIVAWFFAVSGPLLIILNAAQQGNLGREEVATWIFASYGIGGVFGILLSLYYRMPIAAAWSISGAVLVGNFLTHFTFDYAIGVYLITGALCLVLGMSGFFKFLILRVPIPIILGMVAGILLPFGVNIVTSVKDAPAVAGGALVVFLAASLMVKVTKKVPAILWAIVGGVVIATLMGAVQWDTLRFEIIQPRIYTPSFSVVAAAELVVPLALTMIAVQDAQSFAILRGLGYPSPPVNAITSASGAGTIIGAVFGTHGYCTAPVMVAIVGNPEVGALDRRYAAGVINGLLFLPFAVLAPVAASLATILPSQLIRVLGGLALVPVLAMSFGQAFGGKFRLGALFAFMITVSNLTLWNIGAPFWGIVGGVLASLILERGDFRELGKPQPARRATDAPIVTPAQPPEEKSRSLP